METTRTIGEVAALTGIKINTLQIWKQRGFIMSDKSSGWSRFTFQDIMRVALMARLTALGQNISRASYIANGAKLALFQGEDGLRQTLLIVGSDDLFDDDEDQIGLPRFQVIDAGDDPKHPEVHLAEERPAGFESKWTGWTLGSADFLAVNLTDLYQTIWKRMTDETHSRRAAETKEKTNDD